MQQRVEKADEGRIAVVELALAGVLGEVDRQGAIRPHEAEHALHQARRPRDVFSLERGDRRRRKNQRRLLGKADRLFARSHRVAQARPVHEHVFDPAHRLEQIELRGAAIDLVEQRRGKGHRIATRIEVARCVHSTALAPRRGAQVITSPRVIEASTVCTKLFIET